VDLEARRPPNLRLILPPPLKLWADRAREGRFAWLMLDLICEFGVPS